MNPFRKTVEVIETHNGWYVRFDGKYHAVDGETWSSPGYAVKHAAHKDRASAAKIANTLAVLFSDGRVVIKTLVKPKKTEK